MLNNFDFSENIKITFWASCFQFNPEYLQDNVSVDQVRVSGPDFSKMMKIDDCSTDRKLFMLNSSWKTVAKSFIE